MISVTPESLTQAINFHFHELDWQYDPGQDPTIHKIQAEGSARLWNLLLDKKIALLADEVGMGKTLQALAVMITLWQQKPDAKVLLYAPNENVAHKWKREYENFIRYHYRQWDNNIKSAINGVPLRRAIVCNNHMELLEHCNEKWPSFFICKTSSLSNFISPTVTVDTLDEAGIIVPKVATDKSSDDEKSKWVYALGRKSNDRINKLFGRNELPPFDLIIFDEAHYLRRAEGHSFRSRAAHAFFGGRDIRSSDAWDTFKPLADMVLLLTATPNHSATEDINSITSLFRPEYRKWDAHDILKTLCVRRFRRLGGKTKHDYREEMAEGVEMENLRERLFFAAYHKALVKSKSEALSTDQKKRLDNPYRVLFGYLEGFEFLPDSSNGKGSSQVEGTDFNHREDAEVIVSLSQLYKSVYRERPEHPKYKKITEVLTPKSEYLFAADKKLVFVRRIASVYEISGRVVELYDDIFKGLLTPLFSSEELESMNANPRAFFHQLIKNIEEESEPELKGDEDVEETEEGIRDSEILSLFTKRKTGRYQSTDCSNFRIRMVAKTQLFSILFEPGSDYLTSPYTVNTILLNSKGRRLYKATIQHIRLTNLSEVDPTRIALEQNYNLSDDFDSVEVSELHLPTLLTIWLSYPVEDDTYGKFILEAREEYRQFDHYEKEGVSQYLEKGLLFSSQYIVRFYCWYREIIQQSDLRGEELYLAFCDRLAESMDSTGLSQLIAKAVLSFKIFYQKELGKTPSELPLYDWAFLNFTLPVYPYCGKTRRDTIIKAFNSPFYPDVLIATSVLQEGVDLHYHCAEIIHYGIAWTQGDNEQRVGRVDRMFGKLEGQLRRNPLTTLPVHYPYLKNTMDQDQVARFIVRKHHAEKLLDQLKNVQFNSEINFKERISEETWRQLLSTPGKHKVELDPFPVHYVRDFSNITPPVSIGKKSDSLNSFLGPLWNSLKEYYGKDFILYNQASGTSDDRCLFAIKHIRPNGRHQPLIGEIGYSEKGLYFMKMPVYFIRLSTPLTKRIKDLYKINTLGLIKKNYNGNPLLKICFNKQVRDIFRVHVCIDLPLFVFDNQYNLSHQELIDAIESLFHFSDNLEGEISNRDIQNEDVIAGGQDSWSAHIDTQLSGNRNETRLKGWRQSTSPNHIVKEKTIRFEGYEDIYRYNHENHFVRMIYKEGEAFLQAGLYKHDALEHEGELMNKILDSSLG